MVQLTLLTDVGRSELKALLDTLGAEARALGASREATQRAARAVLRRFGGSSRNRPQASVICAA